MNSGGEKEDYKCKLIGGGSPSHLKPYLFCSVAIHYTHINIRYALLLLLTVPMYTTLSKLSEHALLCS